MGGIGKVFTNQVVSSDIIGNVAGIYGEKKSLGDAIKGKLASDDLGNTLHLNDPVAAPAAAAPAAAPVLPSAPAAANELIARKRAAQRTARGVTSTILSDGGETLG